MVKHVKWVCELPIKVQKSVMKDIYMICENNGMTADDIRDNIECAMREKLINLMDDDTDYMGNPKGLTTEKYGKYLGIKPYAWWNEE